MIDYQTFCQIRHLRDEAHLTISQIARQLNLHRQTVSQWEKRPRYEQRQPAAPAVRRASKLDAFKPVIQRLLSTHAYSAAQLLARLQEQGYAGRYSILKAYVRQVRPPRVEAFLSSSAFPAFAMVSQWGTAE